MSAEAREFMQKQLSDHVTLNHKESGDLSASKRALKKFTHIGD